MFLAQPVVAWEGLQRKLSQSWSIFFSSFTIQTELVVRSAEDLLTSELSETRILLLYSTRTEGDNIMRWARAAGLAGDAYVWVATQSVIGEDKEALNNMPPGMLGEGEKSKNGLFEYLRKKLKASSLATTRTSSIPLTRLPPPVEIV